MSVDPCQAKQQVTLLLLRAPRRLLISLFPKPPRQPVIENFLSCQACYLKNEVF